MINKRPPVKGLEIRTAIMIPIQGRGLINHGSALAEGGPQREELSDPYGSFPKEGEAKTGPTM